MKIILFKFFSYIIKLLMPFTNLLKKNNINISKAKKEIEEVYQENNELFDLQEIKNNNTDNNIDLSIIIPVYNAENYLRKCLDSLLNQNTKYAFEVILVNDGSKDNSLNILEEYSKKDSKFKIITQENKGISGARNTGLNNSSGKYVGFIDNDDYITDNYIQKLLDRALTCDADIVKCNYTNFYGETGEIAGTVRHSDCSINGYMGEKILEFKGYIWSGIIKREIWENFRFPLGFWYEDSITRLIIMRKCKKFEYIDESLYFYNIHSNNASKKVWNKSNIKSLDQFFLIKKLVEYGEKIGLPNDITLYEILLWEYTTVLYQRTRKLPKNIKKDIFYMACEFIKKYEHDIDKYDFSQKYMIKSTKNNNYIQYKMISLYNLFNVKINNL